MSTFEHEFFFDSDVYVWLGFIFFSFALSWPLQGISCECEPCAYRQQSIASQRDVGLVRYVREKELEAAVQKTGFLFPVIFTL